MKKILFAVGIFLVWLSISQTIAAQSKTLIVAPQITDIAKITFDKNAADSKIFTRQSLLALLPRLAPGVDPNYGSDLSGQKGTFTLRDGTVLEWWSVSDDSLAINNGKNEQLFIAVAQKVDKKLMLPKVADISTIAFSPSRKKIYTQSSLLKMIPQLVPSRAYNIIKITQRGTLTLKDGTILRWATGYDGQFVIYDGQRRILYGNYANNELLLPKIEDVKEIQTDSSEANWFTPKSLLEVLPKFVRGGSYQPKMIWQYGTIELKNGKILTWRASSKNILMLYNRGGETYFQLPKSGENIDRDSPKISKRIVLRGSINNDFFQMTLEPDDGGVLSGTYFLDKNGWTKAAVVRGKIDENGVIILREFTANGRQTNEFTGKLSANAEDFNLEIEGERRNLRTGKKVSFHAFDEVVDFNNGWHFNTRIISETNKLMKFKIDAAYPEIVGKKSLEAQGFNQAAKAVAIEPTDEFRDGMLTLTAADVKRISNEGNYLYVNYYLHYADNNFVSVEYFFADYMGQAHALNGIETLNYDLKNNRRMELAELFKTDSKYLETISAFCLKNLRERPAQDGFDFAKDLWTESLKPDKDNFQNWCLVKKGLLIVFGSEQITPYSVDAPSVLIPFDELREIAAPEGALAKLSKSKLYEY